MTEIKQVIQIFTSKAVPNIRRLFNFVFPKTGEPNLDTSDRKWLRMWAYFAPFISLGILLAIFLWARVWAVKYELEVFIFSWFVFLPHAFAILYGLVGILLLVIFALILKLKKLDSTILLALTPIAPLKALSVICIFHLMYLVIGLQRPGNVGERGKIHLLQQAFIKQHPNEAYPGDKFFGFTLGKNSYDEVIQILKKHEATFDITSHKDLPEYPVINVTSYSPFNKLYNDPDWFEKAILEFDKNTKLYSVTLIKRKKFETVKVFSFSEPEKVEIKERQRGIEEFKQYLKSAYLPLMEETGFRDNSYNGPFGGSWDLFYTPGGIKIYLDGEKLIFTYAPMIRWMDSVKDWVKSKEDQLSNKKKQAQYLE